MLSYKSVCVYVIPFSIAECACGRKCLSNMPAPRHSESNEPGWHLVGASIPSGGGALRAGTSNMLNHTVVLQVGIPL